MFMLVSIFYSKSGSNVKNYLPNYNKMQFKYVLYILLHQTFLYLLAMFSVAEVACVRILSANV